jgi:hypothetical protein
MFLTRHPRWGLVAALAVGLAPLWLPAPAAAQIVIEGRPEESHWYCTACKYPLGYGNERPDVTECPGCGRRISFGFGGWSSPPRGDSDSGSSSSPTFGASPSLPEIPTPVLAGVAVTALILAVGGVSVLLNRGEPPPPTAEEEPAGEAG